MSRALKYQKMKMKKIVILVVPNGNVLLLFLILYISNYITVNEIGLTTADFFLFATFCALKCFLCYAKMGKSCMYGNSWLKPSVSHGMQSKGIIIVFLKCFCRWIIFEPDDFILDQCDVACSAEMHLGAVILNWKGLENLKNAQFYHNPKFPRFSP